VTNVGLQGLQLDEGKLMGRTAQEEVSPTAADVEPAILAPKPVSVTAAAKPVLREPDFKADV